MKQEEWKPVVNYEGLYEVSDWGRVKSLNYRNTGKEGVLKPSPSGKGYLYINLCKNADKTPVGVHIIVWKTFKGKIPVGNEIDHKDGNPNNNCLENLRCVPHKENCNNPITKQRVTEANKRKAQDKEWQQNVSEAAKRRAQDPEWRRKNAEAGKKRSQNQAWRKNQAEAMQKLRQDPEYFRKNAEAVRKACSKPVDQFTLEEEYIKTWESAAEAARELGLDQSCISACCNGKQKTAYGHIWRRAENKEVV